MDPEVRLAQYSAALDFYLGLLASGVFDHIVYADNSGYPLDALHDKVAGRGLSQQVEFLSYVQTLPVENSRYFLEINLIDQAMARSAVLQADPEAVIWKVTGRYIVSNAPQIVKSWPANTDLYINLRNHPYKTLDFYFVGFRAGRYPDHIGQAIDRYAGTRNGEDILREKLDADAFDGVRVQKRFRHTPRLKGVRGFDGASYGGFKDRVKYEIRRTANIVLPGVWL